jgi:secreted trypsin-like serine protease
VGGKAVPANSTEFFSLASLQSNVYGHLCGGSLIAPSWVLTAAHCVYQDETPDAVLLGSTKLFRHGQAIKRTVTRAEIHERYGDTGHFNDLEQLQLCSPVTTIAPVPLVDSLAAGGTLHQRGDGGLEHCRCL